MSIGHEGKHQHEEHMGEGNAASRNPVKLVLKIRENGDIDPYDAHGEPLKWSQGKSCSDDGSLSLVGEKVQWAQQVLVYRKNPVCAIRNGRWVCTNT